MTIRQKRRPAGVGRGEGVAASRTAAWVPIKKFAGLGGPNGRGSPN